MHRSHVRRGASSILTACAIVSMGCGEDSTGPGGNGNGNGNGGPVMTTSVTVVDNDFQPGAIQVAPGATVTWTWSNTSNQHNVIFSDPAITDSGTQPSGTFATAMPSAPGTYTYECSIHASIGMTGSVVVQ